MCFVEIQEKLKKELSSRGLRLVWNPDSRRLDRDDLVVFGAEAVNHGKPLVAGFGPRGFSERYGNSPHQAIEDCRKSFLDSLEAVGIQRSSLESEYPHVGRGKIWPTFVARLTQEEFRKLQPV